MRHPDPVVQEVIDVWLPRFLDGGIALGDLTATIGRVASWDDWPGEWMVTATIHEELAQAAEEEGRELVATGEWLTAARCHHLGYFVATRDVDLHERGLRRMLACHDRALPGLEPVVERFEVAEHGDVPRVVGLLSVPRGVNRPPVVILLPGLDSTKETRHSGRGGWLRRGMAVVSMDGPGQGEASLWSRIRPDYEVALAAVIDWIESRSDLDGGRIAVAGSSLGGYYAARVASFEPRVRATVVNCGPYDWGECIEKVPQVTKEAFTHYSGAADWEEARRLAGRLTLHGVAERIVSPLMVVHGRADPLIPWQQAQRLADAASGETHFLLVDEGSHSVSNLPYRWAPVAQDWVASHLGASAI